MELTNKQLLKELGSRIVSGRLKLENLAAGGIKDILDEEWEDKTKPDYTGALTGLTYWICEAKNESIRKEIKPHDKLTD